MMKRGLKADLELCNRIKKGTLYVKEHPRWTNASVKVFKYSDSTWENFGQTATFGNKSDADFFVQAREGWPHALERAIEAEELNRELVEVLEGVQRLKPLIAYPDDVLPEFEEEAMAIANMLNVVDSIVAKAKEVPGDGEVR